MSAVSKPTAVLGAVLAGGGSSRFGAPKALALVAGRAVIARVMDALREATASQIVVASDPVVCAGLGARVVADETPGMGPLAGILAALRVAEAEGCAGALCVACDMPFVTPALLGLVVAEAAAHPGQAVVPESPGRRGVEPLCAYYPRDAAGVVQAALLAGERAPHALLTALRTRRIPLAEIRAVGDPDELFFNLNTREDLDLAERIAAGGA